MQMGCNFFANIVYPLLASVFVVVIRYNRWTPVPEQVAAVGTDFCVLAMGATAGVINSPILVTKWGATTTMDVGFSVGIVTAILAAVCVKISESGQDAWIKAKTNLAIGTFGLASVAAINLVACWWIYGDS